MAAGKGVECVRLAATLVPIWRSPSMTPTRRLAGGFAVNAGGDRTSSTLVAMPVCPNGHDNPDGQHFCGECGAQIAVEDVAGHDEERETESETIRQVPPESPVGSSSPAESPHGVRR